MNDTLLQFEITTTLTGPLAERLAQLASRDSKTPVDYLADAVERALQEDPQRQVRAARTRTIEHQNAALIEEGERVQKQISKLQKEFADLNACYQDVVSKIPPPGAFVLIPAVDAITKLARAAATRKLKPDQLARMILEQVAADDLFAAVLDT